MQHPPIIKHQRLPRPQLKPIQILHIIQNLIEFSRRIIPLIQRVEIRRHARPVGVVPPHLGEMAEFRVMREGGEGVRGLDGDAFVAGGVGVDAGLGEGEVGVAVFDVELHRGAEAVDEEGFAARAGGVGEHVEGLEACGFGEVGVVGVGFEGFGGVGGVFGGEVGGEVIEGAFGRG